jgi:uncharacterized damage-inducible protein DinB
MPLVEEAVRMWELFRTGVISELESIPEEQLDFRAGDGARTAREIALHVAEAGVAFTNELLRPEGAFANVRKPEVQAAVRASLPQARTRAELVELLRSTGAGNAARLREVGEALVGQTMQGRLGEQSRLTALWFAVAHEAHHRGQLTAYVRGVGAVPALTRQAAAPGAPSGVSGGAARR